MNKTFLKLQEEWKKLVSVIPKLSKQMLAVITAAVLVAAGGVYLLNTVFLDDSAISNSRTITPKQTNKSGKLLSAVVVPPQKIRDLFHYASELELVSYPAKESKNLSVQPGATTSGRGDIAISATSYGSEITLRGIAKSGLTKYAMITYNGKTQVYRVGEQFGSYSVASITDNAIVLNSPSGPLTIAQRQLQSTAKQPQGTTGGDSVEKQ